MIDVYFMLKEFGEAVGGISLKERDNLIQADVWNVYKVFPITEKTVLFKNSNKEFAVTNGSYRHEMGQIKIKYINNQWINVSVIEL